MIYSPCSSVWQRGGSLLRAAAFLRRFAHQVQASTLLCIGCQGGFHTNYLHRVEFLWHYIQIFRRFHIDTYSTAIAAECTVSSVMILSSASSKSEGRSWCLRSSISSDMLLFVPSMMFLFNLAMKSWSGVISTW